MDDLVRCETPEGRIVFLPADIAQRFAELGRVRIEPQRHAMAGYMRRSLPLAGTWHAGAFRPDGGAKLH